MAYPAYAEYRQPNGHSSREVPRDWEYRRLKFSVTYNDESLPETTDPDFEIAYVDISSVNLVEGITAIEEVTFEEAPSRARRIVRDGDTIISTVRTYLKAIAPIKDPPENMIVSTGFAVIRPLEAVNQRYLGYVLQNASFVGEVVANSTGVSYPAINPSTLVCIHFSYPNDRGVQKKIADFLDWKTGQIDGLISKKKQLAEKLKEKRIALITRAVTKGLNPDAPMRDSGIPWLDEVPDHWEVRRLKFFTKRVFTGSTPPSINSHYFEDSTMNWFTPSDFNDEGTFLSNSSRKLNAIAAEDGSVRLFDQVCVLVVSIGATLGRIGIAMPSFSCNQQINIIVPEETITPKFLFYSLLAKKEPMKVISNATTLGIMNQDKTKQIELSVPGVTEQEEIVSFIESNTEQIEALVTNNEQLIEKLTEYRTALITAATTGKIDVRNVKIGGAE